MSTNVMIQDRPTGGDIVNYFPKRASNASCLEIALGGKANLVNPARTGDETDTRLADWWITGGLYLLPRSLVYEPATGVVGFSNPSFWFAQGLMARMADPEWLHIQRVDLLGTSCYTLDQHYRMAISAMNKPNEVSHSREASPREKKVRSPKASPAARLREVSGLEIERLAGIFDVSRATYYKWMSGSAPRGKRREHILEVLALVQEAAERFGESRDTSNWLLTPVTSDGKKPIDFLALRRPLTFRGFLLQVPTGRQLIRPMKLSTKVPRQLSASEFDDALRRLSPNQRVGDYSAAGAEGDSQEIQDSDDGQE